MYAVTVRDRVMIAHSFVGEVFGPAQALHGATYVVEARFRRERLDPDGLVVDIGLAHDVLAASLAPLRYQNLDALEVFRGINTTTEWLAGWIAERVASAARSGALGPHAPTLAAVEVTLRESDVAWASCEVAVR
jgi:6-pyruvoyltetrahydropterin/6-carboxytetrahydropterin synthase